ncbi:CHZ1 (YER030W) [Zygosaccharomyces parabailii]|uniref:Histone H2A.Z-specific chaperone CHZ1 n=1 Tax=Zygosaccharomyces bailii (strain CLIB 213 / ATCC 58445 / CBS 680 / BCRC 21525 / NBRC 1098 / NCYC 1416 / NRRL Y-2227) TaxID=1333698 RepID=A0A8J2T6F2_ZYGB2|nr:CHZ1 (YER030W) [Zygosaccharomyces parabailii]CDF89783.1 ZYBA0S05-01618g1_1 [Zygosaccharomyces bailii CLIB 213]CDH17542.1 uncharacterized protein ZBAI_09330 [Zygosaccharomyces bailii ISA1307]SJM87048.1 uncharacterized protein ZBIST_3237 [Zygosaccharomyces bailii]
MKETKEKRQEKQEETEEAAPTHKGAEEPLKRKSKDATRPRKRRRNYEENDAKVEGEKPPQEDSDVDDVQLDTLVAPEDEEEDDLAEIDTSNIITTGRRTRGKIIDYKKTAEQLPPRQAEDDESDEDFKET